MKSFGIGAAIAATSLFASSVVADVDPIVIKGSKFFYKTNGTQFYIRGVAYQQDYAGNGTMTDGGSTTQTSYTDPLADSASCMRDIPYLTQLRTNTIRVYAIDPTKNHDDCMNALAAAGIYVISDMSDPTESIDRNSPQWNVDLYARYTSVIDALAKYSNTLGFFAGNEVSNSYNTTAASAFVKAAVRDSKAYIKSQNYRPLGVGYASDDDATIRDAESDYMNCGDQSTAIDFWGYNIYEWCGQSSFQQSGYADRTKDFANYSVPVFFAEYGCNTVQPRTFGDTPVLYGSDMEDVWSGGIVYMYFQESNDFGLVSVSGNSVSTLPDFSYLSSQIATVSPSGTSMSNYSPSNSPRNCPATGSTWAAAASPLPPPVNPSLCDCIYESLSCVVASGTSTSNYGDLFSTVCGLDINACNGINTNNTGGQAFGAYGMCNSTVQLSYAFNQYYVDQNSNPSACAFKGAATVRSAASAASSCSSLISAAGTTGAVSNTAGATGNSGSGSGSSGSSTGKSSAPGGVAVLNGVWQIPFLVTLGLLSGVGMILL